MYEATSSASAQTVTPNSRLPLPVVIYLIAIALPIKFNIGSLSLNGVRLLLLVVIIPLLINLFRGKYGRILPTDVLFILHVFWVVVSLAINNPAQALQFGGSISLEFLGGYMLARAYIRDKGSFLKIVRILSIIVLGTLPLAIYESLTGDPILIEIIRGLPGVNTESNVQQAARLGLERAQTVFPHPIHYGLFASLLFSLIFVGLRRHISTAQRYFLSMVVAICVFFSLSSGALLPLIMQVGLIFWAWVFPEGRTRWLILIGLLISSYILVDLLSNRTPLRVFMTYATFSPQNAYWRVLIFEFGIENVWQNPIFGLGLNDWIRPWWMPNSVDNFWLLMAMMYGIPGFLFLAAGTTIALVRISFRHFEGSEAIERVRLAWVFSFIGIMFSLSTVHVWSSVYSFIFFMFGAGMWLWSYSNHETNDTQDPIGMESKRYTPHLRRVFTEKTQPSEENESEPDRSTYTRFPRGNPDR